MSGARSRAVATGMAALAGASAWISLGTLAVTQADSRMRIVALPPVYLLALLAGAAAAGAWMSRVSPARLRPLALTSLLWLPFVPGQVPSAFLIWQGPIEGLVWLMVAAGVLAEWSWPRPALLHTLAVDPAIAPWSAGLLSAVLFAVGAIALADRLPNGDEPHYLMIAQSLLHDRDLQIQNNHERLEYQPFWSNELTPHYVARGTNGQIYSVHSPGVAAMVLPGFGLFGYSGAQATIIAAAATTTGILWYAAWLLTASAMAAWVTWAALALASPFFLHAFAVFPDAPGAFCVATAVALLVHLETRGAARRAPVWITGAALAALPWLHTRFAILAVALGLVLGLRLARQQTLLAVQFFIVPTVSALAWFGYFWAIWGTANPAAPYGALTDMAWDHIGPGALGLLVDQRYGLLAAAPAFVCGVAGLVLMARSRTRIAAELLLVAVPYFVAASAYGMWWGGFGGPARFLVVIFPLAALPVAWLWSSGGAVSRALTGFLALTGVAMLVPRVIVDGGAMAFAETDNADPLLMWAAPSVDLPAALLSLHAETVWRDALIWAAIGLAVIGGVCWFGRWRRLGREAAWLAISAAAALSLMVGATASWREHGTSGLAPATSQLSFLNGWNPRLQSTDLQWRPPYRVSAPQLIRRIEVPIGIEPAAKGRRAPAFTAAPHLAAASYSIMLDGTPPPSGELVATIGDGSLSIERWRLDELGHAPFALPLRLPVAVIGLSISGDAAAVASIENGSLRLTGVQPPATGAPGVARRAARFGALRVFFLDDRAYPEPAGFWTRGKSRTAVLLDPDPTVRFDSVTVALQSGPLAGIVDLALAGAHHRVQLGAHERQEVVFPMAAGSDRVLSIRTDSMFTPVQYDTSNRDFRQLGVWVEVR